MTITEAYSPSNLHEASNPKLCLHASQDRRLTTSVTWPGSGSPDLYLVTTTVLPCVCCVSGPCQALKIQGRHPKGGLPSSGEMDSLQVHGERQVQG